jgi:hypothetical protein
LPLEFLDDGLGRPLIKLAMRKRPLSLRTRVGSPGLDDYVTPIFCHPYTLDQKGFLDSTKVAMPDIVRFDEAGLPAIRTLQFDESTPQCSGNRVGSIRGVQLLQNVLDVGVHRGFGKSQLVGNLLVPHSGCN